MITNETIRQALRAATDAAHAQLDGGMAALDLANPADYAQFLRVQYAARAPIEDWAARHCPFELQPPAQTPLIAADLAALGAPLPDSPAPRFSAAADGALGVAWALGGSSLGNRAMLAGLRKRGADVPVHFLADPAMPAFFARLRPRLDQPAAGHPALAASIAAAHAVFGVFTAVHTDGPWRHAA